MKLLATEDHITRNSLSNMVRETGHECHTFTSILESITVSEKEKPDAVLVDMEWASDNAEELISQFKLRFPDTPTIAISAQDDDRVIDRLFHMGITAYLMKPFKHEALLETLEGLSFAKTHTRLQA